MGERYSHFQFSKDVLCETDKKLTENHYSAKGGHKARHDFQKERSEIVKITKEIPSKGVIFESRNK
jgi:hypothetical protein